MHGMYLDLPGMIIFGSSLKLKGKHVLGNHENETAPSKLIYMFSPKPGFLHTQTAHPSNMI